MIEDDSVVKEYLENKILFNEKIVIGNPSLLSDRFLDDSFDIITHLKNILTMMRG